MNENELVALKLTVAEWNNLLWALHEPTVFARSPADTVFWGSTKSLERQLDEIVAAVDAKEKYVT